MQASGARNVLPIKVLLVADSRNGLVARRTVLAENGYEVTGVDRADQVLPLLEESRFNLVVTDYKLQKSTGTQLIACIRAAGHKQPVILISGYVEALGLNEANTGADIVIQKGALEVPQLLHAVRSLLNVRKPMLSVRSIAPRRRRKA
jgi:DNA-binding NtrC family response regulator